MNGRPLATKILSVGIQMDWQLGQCCLDGWNAGIAGSLQVRFELAHCLKGLALQSLGVAHKHTWPFRQLVTLCFVPAVTRVWNTWSSYKRFKKVVTTVTTHDMDHMNDMDDILGNPKAFFAASGWCSAYMAPKHLAQIITVLLSQPDPFNSLTSRHVKRPSLDLLILHDAAENSAIAVAMLCFSQLQRQMFAPRGFVSSKLGKQNARWILNKSLLPYREPHPDNCTMFEHAKYDSWSGSSKVGSTGSTSARPFWVENINSAKDFARGLWQFSLTMAMVISRIFPSQLHLHGTTMFYTCTGWGKATSKSLNYSWFRPAVKGKWRKWSCYCCTWLQVITNRNGWQGGCQW